MCFYKIYKVKGLQIAFTVSTLRASWALSTMRQFTASGTVLQ